MSNRQETSHAKSTRSRVDQSFGQSSMRRSSFAHGRSKAERSALLRGTTVSGRGADGARKLVPDAAHPNVAVVDDRGRDVTPLSLLKGGMQSVSVHTADLSAAVSMSGELQKSGDMSRSMHESGSMMVSASMREGGAEGSFSEMTGGVSGGGAAAPPVESWSKMGAGAEADDDEDAAPLTEEELKAPVPVVLTETETFFWLDREGEAVGKDAQDEHAAVSAANERFTKQRATKEASTENFSERHAQTFVLDSKVKETSTVPRVTSDMGAQANLWAIEDAYTAAAGAADKRGGAAGGDVSLAVADVAGGAGAAAGEGSVLASSHTSGAGGGESASTSLASFNPGASGAIERSGQTGQDGSRSVDGSQSEIASTAQGTSSEAPTSLSQTGEAYNALTAAGGVGATVDPDAVRRARAQAKLNSVLKSDSFREGIRVLERMITQNNMHTLHLKYRDIPLGTNLPPNTLLASALALGADAKAAADSDADELAALQRARRAARSTSRHSAEGGEQAGGKERRGRGGEGADGKGGGAAGRAGASLEPLWSFACPETAGQNVSSLAWNSSAHDVLAAAYGSFEFTGQKPGLVALWALQCPHYPQRLWKVKCGATAVAFSRAQPHLLAVGLYTGMVSVYDVRSADSKPASEANHITGKHNEPVWEVKWVNKLAGGGGDEALVSVSTDGRVTQWALKKGLERTDLMRLKRLPGVAGSTLGRSFAPALSSAADGGEKGGEKGATRRAAAVDVGEGGIISRRAAGLSVDFSPTDPSVYICGARRARARAAPARGRAGARRHARWARARAPNRRGAERRVPLRARARARRHRGRLHPQVQHLVLRAAPRGVHRPPRPGVPTRVLTLLT